MPRRAREISYLRINHVILRGINQQIIFEDDTDYLQFISILKYYKEPCGYKIYAYCLMNNHIHLLLEHTSMSLGTIMKRIEVKFVRWYNLKYHRIGNLFQDRYKSEPVNDMQYFQNVFRYIHQNPLHAGLEDTVGTYRWSSYHAYARSDASFVDIDKAFQLFQNHAECITFLKTDSKEKCLEYISSTPRRFTDSQALDFIHEKTSCKSPSDFQHLDLFQRNHYLVLLHDAGLSIRQLSRLTGISRTAINMAVEHSTRYKNI